MKLENLNLATHPFKNRRLPYLLVFFFLISSVLIFIFSVSQYRETSKRIETVQSQLRELQFQVNEYRGRNEQIRQTLTPEQKTLLVAAHKLVAQKSFGWSRLLSDLEKLMPADVSVSRINVENVFRKNDRIRAELELSLLSKDYRSVMNLIETMNSSGVFRAELKAQSLQKKDYFTYTEYKLFVIYNQPFFYSVNEEVARKEEKNNE